MQRLSLRWDRRTDQERSDIFVPGGMAFTLKWERAEVPQLRPRMLDAGGANREQLVLWDTLH